MRRLRLFREAQTFRFSVVEIEVELRRRSRLGDLGNLCRLPGAPSPPKRIRGSGAFSGAFSLDQKGVQLLL